MPKALIIDTVRCTGCRGCQAACKQWNLLPAVKTTFSPTQTNPPEKNAFTYVNVEFHEILKANGDMSWHFVSKRCFHCSSPACVSVCPVGALHKRDNGPVAWDESRCIGCRYCQNACPFDIPKFEWDKAYPKIQKCHMCWDSIEDGMEPACAKTCPPSAIEFGERPDMLAAAHARIDANPNKYQSHIYGEREAGGTSVLFLSSVAPEELGFNTDIEDNFYPELTGEFLSRIPLEMAAVAGLMGAALLFRRKRLG